jgi:hypothetical protein
MKEEIGLSMLRIFDLREGTRQESYDGKLHNLHISLNIVGAMRWAERVASTGRCEVNTTFWFENLNGRDQLGGLRGL